MRGDYTSILYTIIDFTLWWTLTLWKPILSNYVLLWTEDFVIHLKALAISKPVTIHVNARYGNILLPRLSCHGWKNSTATSNHGTTKGFVWWEMTMASTWKLCLSMGTTGLYNSINPLLQKQMIKMMYLLTPIWGTSWCKQSIMGSRIIFNKILYQDLPWAKWSMIDVTKWQM